MLAVLCSACRIAEAPVLPAESTVAIDDPITADATHSADEREPVATPLLDPDQLVYLPAPGNGLFQLRHEQPSLALRIEVEPSRAAHRELAEQLADGEGLRPISDAQAEQLGLVRPEHVWMFGRSGPCEAALGSAYAIGDAEGSLVLELGYVVEPCTDEFAPLAQLGATPAPLIWRGASCSQAEPITTPETWQHPERAAYEQLGVFDWQPTDEHPNQPEQRWVRSCGIESVVAELGWSWVWPDSACWEAEHVSRDIGLWRDGTLELLPRLEEGVAPELVGALLADGAVVAILASGWPDLHVGMHTDQGFVWAAKVVGNFHDEVVAASDPWSVLDCDDEP